MCEHGSLLGYLRLRIRASLILISQTIKKGTHFLSKLDSFAPHQGMCSIRIENHF